MNKIVVLSLAVLMVVLAPVRPASAFPVIDAANLIQNTLSAIQQLEEIEHQISQIRNQARSLENEARNLRGLNFSVVADLRATTEQVNQLIRQAQGIAFEVQAALREFERLYPKRYAEAVTGGQLAADTIERWRHSFDALATTIRVQSQAAQNFSSDEASLTALVERSQAAEGSLQASQVTNQLLALHARQMIQDQQLRIAQDRATALEQARMLAANERSRAVRQYFMTGSTRYTPEDVTIYRN
jgi:P-type conjugative transfer protein TrbJ